MDVEDAVRTEIERWGRPIAVHRAVHGTEDPSLIADQVVVWCHRVLGQGVAEATFHVVSAGSVTGVVLDDGSTVVIKAYQPHCTSRFLSAVVSTQRGLASAGVPCASPIAGPEPLGAGLATAEEHLDDPGQPSEFGPAEMEASARGLCALVGAAPWSEGLRGHPMQSGPPDALYPPPHSPEFDFESTAAGAEWIDALATKALPRLGVGPEVVAHSDWSARNVRLSAAGVRAIYDMDSLSIVPLSMALANGATTWRSTGEAGDDAAPDVDDVEAWLTAWPMPLDTDVRASAYASVVYQLAYPSRCEHAIDPREDLHRRARPTLRRDGAELLRRAGLDP